MSKHHPKLTKQLRIAAQWLRAMAGKNPRAKKQLDELADRDVAAATAIELLEKELETIMGRYALAIDKLESRIDDLNTAVAARDRKITSLTGQLATAIQNATDDVDQADAARVEGQVFDPIPPVADDTTTTTTTPPADTTTPPVTTGA